MGVPAAIGKDQKVYPVCAHGCKYRTISAAVKAVKDGSNSVIKIRPGTYKEGVTLVGHKYDGLSFVGSSGNPRNTILEGDNAKLNGTNEIAQNGIDATNVNGLRIENLWARHFQTNGFFVHSDTGTTNCKGFLMKHDLASFNRSYGLFAKRCIGGRITQSTGWGHGDSAIYIGETPPQAKPKWTSIDHDIAFENVLGYSGTNSKYVDIHDSDFFNNGAGVVPNTLDSEAFQPNSNGRVRNNDIFWNNFDYFLPNSPVETVSGGLGHIGDATINYPTGVGVILFGSDGWTVQDNRIFGNFMWGAAAFSDPFNTRRRQPEEPVHRQPDGPKRHRHEPVRLLQRRLWQGNLLHGEHVVDLRRHPGRPPLAGLPVSGLSGSQQGNRQQPGRRSLGLHRPGRRAGGSTCSATRPASRRTPGRGIPHPPFEGRTPIDTRNFGNCS